MKKSPVSLYIKYICIDSESVRSKLPKYISSVPALVVGNTNQIYIGDQIIGWEKISSGKISNKKSETLVPVSQSNNMTNDNSDPDAWHTNEMNAFSDAYSFIGIDTTAQGNGGMSMVHNFEILEPSNNQNNRKGSIFLPGGAPSGSSMPVNYKNPLSNNNPHSSFGSIQMSEKAELLDKQMKDMLNKRELDVPNVPTRI